MSLRLSLFFPSITLSSIYFFRNWLIVLEIKWQVEIHILPRPIIDPVHWLVFSVTSTAPIPKHGQLISGIFWPTSCGQLFSPPNSLKFPNSNFDELQLGEDRTKHLKIHITLWHLGLSTGNVAARSSPAVKFLSFIPPFVKTTVCTCLVL